MLRSVLASMALGSTLAAFAADDPGADHSFEGSGPIAAELVAAPPADASGWATDIDGGSPMPLFASNADASLDHLSEMALREPGTMEMMAAGLLGLLAFALRRRNAH